MFIIGGHPAPPARPASPLPPNVPTGPRNQNKYKDRDNNAQAVDGLDYGGGGGGVFGGLDRGRMTPVEFDDRTGREVEAARAYIPFRSACFNFHRPGCEE